MQVLKRGHVYRLDQRLPEKAKNQAQHEMLIEFVNLEPGHEAPGTTTQEIMRVLIDRTHYCNNCLPHRVNEQIIWHMRQIIALHEARAIEQKAWKGEISIEHAAVGHDGHLKLDARTPGELEELYLKLVPKLGTQKCDHRSGE